MSDTTATAQDRPKSKQVGALRGLMPFLRPYRGLLVLALMALVLTASVSLILPLAVRRYLHLHRHSGRQVTGGRALEGDLGQVRES